MSLDKFQPRLYEAFVRIGDNMNERLTEVRIWAYSYIEAAQVLGRLHFGSRPPAKVQTVNIAVKIVGHWWNRLVIDSNGIVSDPGGYVYKHAVEPPKPPKDESMSLEAECVLALIARAS